MRFLQRAKFFFGQGFDDYIQRFLAGEDVPDINHTGQVDSQTAMKYLKDIGVDAKRLSQKGSPLLPVLHGMNQVCKIS